MAIFDEKVHAGESKVIKGLEYFTYKEDLAPTKSWVGSEKWIVDTEKQLEIISGNRVGEIILSGLKRKLSLGFEQYKSSRNAESKPLADGGAWIEVTNKSYPGGGQPGAAYDEILLHEICHVVDGFRLTYEDHLAEGFLYDTTDFFTVTATNVYASTRSRPLRKDHREMELLMPEFRGPKGEVAFNKLNRYNLNQSWEGVGPEVYNKLVFVRADWNPFS